MASKQQMKFVWSLTRARREVYSLYSVALAVPQIITRRGVLAYVFRPATARERKDAGSNEMVIAQVLVIGSGRN